MIDNLNRYYALRTPQRKSILVDVDKQGEQKAKQNSRRL